MSCRVVSRRAGGLSSAHYSGCAKANNFLYSIFYTKLYKFNELFLLYVILFNLILGLFVKFSNHSIVYLSILLHISTP